MSARETEPSNAFALLMSTGRKRQRASRFVLCPIGCLQHIAEKDINRHIDQCLLQEKINQATQLTTSDVEDCTDSEKQAGVRTEDEPRTPPMKLQTTAQAAISADSAAVVSHEKQFPASKPTANISDHNETNTNGLASQPQLPASVSQSQWEDKIDKQKNTSEQQYAEIECRGTELSPRIDPSQEQTLHQSTSILQETNAFARMLSQSKVFFSSKDKSPKEQCFHLHENGAVSISPTGSANHRTAWKTTITIKDRSLSQDRQPTEFLVTLSSALPSHFQSTETVPPQWVQRHSRLSVPVLKSILQKSIRRRRPLPSVKVAMELADKSLGELLRRLPIIILEDSTLHPDFDLLVWLMMAHSKDYSIPSTMLARVFEIIFEICMCPWIDSCSSVISAGRNQQKDVNDSCTATSLTSLHEELSTHEITGRSSLIWAMLARAEYGGMKGDVNMLRSFATVWKNRFESDGQCPTLGIRWTLVPATIHEKTRDQAHQLVSELCQSKLRRLTLNDISVQGIDFHCSSIIDHLLSDDPLRELCHDLLKLNGDSDTCSQLSSMLKQCLWDHSAGVNRRQPLDGGRKESRIELLHLWNELIAPRVSTFQTAYVEQRLA